VADLDVVGRAELQEALDARARMLWAGALVTVRQEHDEPGEAHPLVFGGHDELIDDHLRAVHEVAELRLPYDEALGAVEAVAVVEGEDALLGERTVVDLELAVRHGVLIAERGERRVA